MSDKRYRRYWEDSSKFNMLSDVYGSKFDAIHHIIDCAKDLSRDLGNTILDSSALVISYSQYVPKYLESDKIQSRLDKKNRTTDQFDIDALNYITDNKIKESIINSLQESTSVGHLVYQYHSGLSEDEMARVRVVCRMIWDSKDI